ncbi:TyrR/PhhR family helix-turn-helix DNA-binding protein [Microbulbifer thermotolerans]|uniref:PAS domain-containing protein n=2 Tax=Microbulbifer thermotolerans TaxID=252514 RepID=A0AB35I3C2_MICTH|nr:TyrR/PhhR family helix-turn-helix DNA-binding protein [Microbulbifer thermotolerans]MCX2802865.1 PAS domain-containing protein [Microbulbifer thermotolerans]MCX2834340.1 PAS domain-containing protein [Microbulbifer thermotolerans]
MRIEITCANRVGILSEIMDIFGEYRINVTSGELGGDSGDKVYLSAPGMLATQYQTIEKSLYKVPGVQRVRRIALIPSERRNFELDTLLRHVADPVLSVDREGRVVAANLAAARAFGVNLDRVPGLQLQRFLPLMQVAELLRDFTVPRYGLPVVVRGRSYRMDWAPIALADGGHCPGSQLEAVDSLAGAVLTMQPWGSGQPLAEQPRPAALWDFGERRQTCLQLQEMATLGSPLLIAGECGSGKSTFAAALHYLSPLGTSGGCYRCTPCEGRLQLPASLRAPATLILEDLHHTSAEAQVALVRNLWDLPREIRLVATCTTTDRLQPVLVQLFSSLALRLPPLRTMRPSLARFAAAIVREETAADGGADPLPIHEDVLPLLRTHDWPDNFNGLKDYLSVAVRRCRARGGDRVEPEDLPDLAVRAELPWRNWGRGLSYREMMEQVERALLTDLAAEQPSARKLAKRLGISHTAVANKLRKYGIFK